MFIELLLTISADYDTKVGKLDAHRGGSHATSQPRDFHLYLHHNIQNQLKTKAFFDLPSPTMPAFQLFVVDGKPIEGVYGQIDMPTYKKHTQVRSKALTVCATCGQESKHLKEDGVMLKVCRGVR